MRDKASIAKVNDLHPAIRQRYIDAVDFIESGFPETIAVRTVQGLRTFEYQHHLYQLGRTIKNPDGYDAVKKPLGDIITKAEAGQGFHCYGLAGDFCIVYDKDGNGTYEKVSWDMVVDGDFDHIPDWTEVRTGFEKYGFEWGGKWRTFKDNPHVQRVYGFTWKELLIKYNNKDFLPGTTYVKLIK